MGSTRFAPARAIAAVGVVLGLALVCAGLTLAGAPAAAHAQSPTLQDGIRKAVGGVVTKLPYYTSSDARDTLPQNPLQVSYHVAERQSPEGAKGAVPISFPALTTFGLDYRVIPASAGAPRTESQVAQAWADLRDPCGKEGVEAGSGGAASCVSAVSQRGTLDPASYGDPYTGDSRVYVVTPCADIYAHVGLGVYAAASHGARNKPEVIAAMKSSAKAFATTAAQALQDAVAGACGAPPPPNADIPPTTGFSAGCGVQIDLPNLPANPEPADAPPDGGAQLQIARAAPGCDPVAARAAFMALMPVFNSPRCANCHGRFDVTDQVTAGLHPGGFYPVVDDVPPWLAEPSRCAGCHSDPAVKEGVWKQPNAESVAHWGGKSAAAICRAMMAGRANGTQFVEHLKSDVLVTAGFAGTAGGASAVSEMPPRTQAKFIEAAQAWVNAMDAVTAWPDPSQGCP